MMNHLQPSRKKRNWKKIALYIILAAVFYIALKQIFSNRQDKKSVNVHHLPHHAKHNKLIKQQTILHFKQDNSTYLDFPWYQKEHTRPQFQPNSTLLTFHLSPKERQILEKTAILQAKKLALRRFSAEDYQQIRGTNLSPQESAAVRAKIDCWTQGEWVKDNKKVYQLKHVQDPIYSVCDDQFYKTHSPTEKREAIQYRWQPKNECTPLKSVEPKKWCKALHGRHMLLVGDLVHYQYHEVLLDAFRDEPTVCFGELNCKDHTICKSPKDTRLRYIRNDILSTIRKIQNRDEGHPLGNIVEWPFVTSNILHSYPVVMLSRKSVLGDDDLTFTRRLIQTMKVLRETSPNALVIYKSSFIGHPFCNDAQGPLDTALTEDQLKQLPFGWSETKRRNAIAKTVVEAAGGLYIDLASMIDLRPDGHIGGQDCSRYCIPGPLDATVQLLYNVFLELKLTKQ